MGFINSKTIPPIATYSIMSADGRLPDRASILQDVSNEPPEVVRKHGDIVYE